MRRYGSILLVAVVVVTGFLLLGHGIRLWSEWREAREISAQAGRLEENVRPLAYRITLTIDPTSDHFYGEASIRIHLAQARRAIWLHGRGLKIRSAMATDARGRHVRARWKTLGERGLARLLLGETLARGEALLHLRYEGRISKSGEGLFRVRRAGRNHVFSQMQPIAARSVFPAFDQPNFKTPFEISVRTPPGNRVISNAPLAGLERGRDGWRTWKFQPSRPLPTYLVAFAVGPLVEVGETNAGQRRPPMRAFGVSGGADRRALSRLLGNARILLGDLEGFFRHPYPFAKLDLLAVPDFTPLGMENAGAVMLRESLVAAFADAPDPLVHPPGSRRWREWLVADPRRYRAVHWLIHQLAHQWIGNLVTPAWWSDLWFSESFGRWVADHELRRLTGDDGLVDLKAGLRALRAMEFDVGERARPLHRKIVTTDDILTVFDPPLYDKGASVIAMIERFSKHDIWRRVWHQLLASSAGSNIDTATLADALATVAGDPEIVGSLVDFVHRTGVPLLEISGRCAPTGDAGGEFLLRVTQSRFRPFTPSSVVVPPDAGWRIPLCLNFGQGQARPAGACRLLPARPRHEFALSASNGDCPPKAMRAAPAERGYYRYLPDREMRDDLWRHLDSLAADEAISLTDHLVSAMIAGRMTARELMARLEALAASPHWPALVPQIDHLHRWRVLLPPGSAMAHAWSGYLRRLYGLALKRARRPDRNPVYPAAFRREAHYRLAAAWIVDGGIDAPDARIVELLDTGTEKPERAAQGQGDGGEIPSFAWTLDLAALRRDPARALPPIAERLRQDASPGVRRGALLALAHSGLEPADDALKAYALSPEADGRDVVMILELLSRDPARARDHWRWVNEWHERFAERLNVFTRPALIRVAAGLCDRAAADRLAATVSRWREPLAGRSVVVHQTASRIRACAAERQMLVSALARAFGNDRSNVRPGAAGGR